MASFLYLRKSSTKQLAQTAEEVVKVFHLNIGYTILEFHGTTEGEDNADGLEVAIHRFGGKLGKIIFVGNRTYRFSRKVYALFNISMDLGLSKISPMEDGNYYRAFIFYVNAAFQGETIESWGGEYIATIHRGRFVNKIDYPNIKGFHSRSKTNFEDITFSKFA